MPTTDFWFLAGLGVAMIGFGVMRYFTAKADAIETKRQRRHEAN